MTHTSPIIKRVDENGTRDFSTEQYLELGRERSAEFQRASQYGEEALKTPSRGSALMLGIALATVLMAFLVVVALKVPDLLNRMKSGIERVRE